jgi:hypothetical protein
MVARSMDESIDARLRELDGEWDVERVLETHSSAITLFGLALGFLGRRRWFAVPLVVQGFSLVHALRRGWCPPLPLLRALGFRSSREIELDRHALEALRGESEPRRRGATRSRRTKAR